MDITIFYINLNIQVQKIHAIEESLFTHTKNRTQPKVIGIINNRTKEFRLEASKYRDNNTIKKFLNKFIDSGNTIISDGWSGYNFISNFNDQPMKHVIMEGGFWHRYSYNLFH